MIKSLTLSTAELEKTADFYDQNLGFTLVRRTDNRVVLQAGETELVFEAAAQASPFYHFAFDIPENKLLEAKDWLETKVPLLVEEGDDVHDFPDWNAQGIYFHDPNGNIVEFIARHNLDNGVSEAFDVKHILSISEIGCPMDTPRRAFEKFALPAWRDYGQFLCLGDESGMIVVCQQGRGWKPTRRPAERHDVKLTINHGGKTRDYSW